MAVPLYEAKADLFRTLGHPTRVRVLELLAERPRQVKELLAEIGIEASNLSQQLSVLRRAGLVTASRQGVAVTYAAASPQIADLLAAGRTILASVWSDTEGMLHELRETS
ncbi:ArsR/SmtB family transcription factor [Nocardioides campestrisoli]|uniref:ArsR/SmtB family transcription factor n=1 Tax=Nocardioides campestrisoli TaxID=2736757 RepID=UPI0015E63631|nr:metalloregulator ArsR/SmtB family transcription factor [Nocardioides campestrisoli]